LGSIRSYLDAPYYVYPDGELAAEAFRVIGEAMEKKGLVGIGRVTIASRERLVLVEPHGSGLLMSTLRSADEVRPAERCQRCAAPMKCGRLSSAPTRTRRRTTAEPAAVGYGITNRNLLAIRRRGSVSCGPPPRSVIKPRRLKSYPNLDNCRLSPGQTAFAAP
jgi:hypothetical protein